MKCQVLLINRGRSKYYKRASYNETRVKVGKREFYIPDQTKSLELEKMLGTTPLWVVDELTSCVLGWDYGDFNFKEIEQNNKKTYVLTHDKDKNKIIKPSIIISQKSDPLTRFKLNTLAKTSFWEMLSKKLKLSMISMLVYMGAGYGLFRFAEYVVRIIFLKQA